MNIDRPFAIAILLLLALPAHAQDNNPFSGAREIRVVMVRDKPPVAKRALQQKRIIAAKSQQAR